MKAKLLAFLCVAFLATGLGCRAHRMASPPPPMTSLPEATKHASASPAIPGGSGPDTTPVRADRMLVWKAELSVDVENVGEAVAQATEMAQRREGYVEKCSVEGNSNANLTIRIPVAVFQPALIDLQGLGKATRRSVDSEDVTEEYVDVEARMKAKTALRDRLLKDLEKATDMKDILALETEVNRVQSDLESMTARLKALKGKADLATVAVHFNHPVVIEPPKPKPKPIPGPVTLVFDGVSWVIGKLFWIRE